MLSTLNLTNALTKKSNNQSSIPTNLIDDNYQQAIAIELQENNETGLYTVSLEFETNLIGTLNEKSNNVGILSNFVEVPVLGILATDINDVITKKYYEPIFAKTFINQLERKEFLLEYYEHCNTNNKDFFHIMENENQIDLIRIFTMYVSTSIGLYLDSKAIRNKRKSANKETK